MDIWRCLLGSYHDIVLGGCLACREILDHATVETMTRSVTYAVELSGLRGKGKGDMSQTLGHIETAVCEGERASDVHVSAQTVEGNVLAELRSGQAETKTPAFGRSSSAVLSARFPSWPRSIISASFKAVQSAIVKMHKPHCGFLSPPRAVARHAQDSSIFC